MVYYLIICRSLTYAQRSARVLERAGISGYVMRAPKSVVGEGCSHCVRVAEKWLAPALAALKREGLGFTGSGEGMAAHAVVLLEEA